MNETNLSKGIIKISNDIIIHPKYSFDEYKKSSLYNGENGIRVIYLDNYVYINSNKFLITLFFKNNQIYIVSLTCCDINCSIQNEPKRKKLHDKILKKWNMKSSNNFTWGKIISVYDLRSNSSSIDIEYYIS